MYNMNTNNRDFRITDIFIDNIYVKEIIRDNDMIEFIKTKDHRIQNENYMEF